MSLKSREARDPERIPKVLERLRRIWIAYPDLRLTQLIINLEFYTDKKLYQVEDDEICNLLEKFYP